MDYETFLELFRKEITPIIIFLCILVVVMFIWSLIIVPYIVDDLQHDKKIRDIELENKKISSISERVKSEIISYYDTTQDLDTKNKKR